MNKWMRKSIFLGVTIVLLIVAICLCGYKPWEAQPDKVEQGANVREGIADEENQDSVSKQKNYKEVDRNTDEDSDKTPSGEQNQGLPNNSNSTADNASFLEADTSAGGITFDISTLDTPRGEPLNEASDTAAESMTGTITDSVLRDLSAQYDAQSAELIEEIGILKNLVNSIVKDVDADEADLAALSGRITLQHETVSRIEQDLRSLSEKTEYGQKPVDGSFTIQLAAISAEINELKAKEKSDFNMNGMAIGSVQGSLLSQISALEKKLMARIDMIEGNLSATSRTTTDLIRTILTQSGSLDTEHIRKLLGDNAKLLNSKLDDLEAQAKHLESELTDLAEYKTEQAAPVENRNEYSVPNANTTEYIATGSGISGNGNSELSALLKGIRESYKRIKEVREAVEDYRNTLVARLDKFDDNLVKAKQGISEMDENARKALVESSSELVGIRSAQEEHIERIRRSVDELTHNCIMLSIKAGDYIDITSTNRRIDDAVLAQSETLKNSVNDLTERMRTNSAAFDDSLASEIDNLSKTLTEDVTVLTNLISSNRNDANESLQKQVNEINTRISREVSTLSDMMQATSAAINAKIDRVTIDLNNRIASEADTLSDAITDSVQKLTAMLDTCRSDLSSEFAAQLSSSVSELTAKITTEADTIRTLIASDKSELDRRITAEVETLNQELAQNVNRLSIELNNSVTELQQALELAQSADAASFAAISSNLIKNTDNLINLLSEKSSSLETLVAEKEQLNNQKLEEQSTAWQQVISGINSDITRTQSNIENLINSFNSQISTVEGSLADTLSTTASELNRQLNSLSEQTANAITELKSSVDEVLSEVKEDISGVREDVSVVRDDVSGVKNEIFTKIRNVIISPSDWQQADGVYSYKISNNAILETSHVEIVYENSTGLTRLRPGYSGEKGSITISVSKRPEEVILIPVIYIYN